MDAVNIVPGDVLIVRLGDIVPADIKILGEVEEQEEEAAPMQVRSTRAHRAAAAAEQQDTQCWCHIYFGLLPHACKVVCVHSNPFSCACCAAAVAATCVQIDQAALTGESLPVKKFTGDVAFSGSTVKQGERHALVYATGEEARLICMLLLLPAAECTLCTGCLLCIRDSFHKGMPTMMPAE
jgi:hypothetical protein